MSLFTTLPPVPPGPLSGQLPVSRDGTGKPFDYFKLVNYLMSDRPGVREQKLGRRVKALFLATGVSDQRQPILAGPV